ncbi:glycoprotein 3-alpha-L-fucosyltransferase A-like [Convolutriloba macropyga]|uniref:glycoprotein 3-alpha-L-fucosyltransferase A-like n=1 Tax=Convolutriloba macropyga TaxID=536237 RepID=UPI003F524C83
MYSEEAAEDIRSSSIFERFPILNKMFNWTIFLSRTATIQKKFIHVYKKSENDTASGPKEKFITPNKTKDFCWMISNCGSTFSKARFKVADALIKSLTSKVHIWGHATGVGCVNGSHPNVVSHGPIGSLGTSYYDVAQKHIKDCKFYFAFENSNCSDYVTEKFLNSIEVGAIPIVVGWWDTYRELLPGSFIHVSEFENPTQLAEYLEGLLRDEKKMKKYQEWREVYRYERTGYKASCELCRKLEKLKLAQIAGAPPEPSIIPNMAEKYMSLQNCASKVV